jgi:hypothetical protein
MARHPRRCALKAARERPAWARPLESIRQRDPARYRVLIGRLLEASWLTGHEGDLFWGPPVPRGPERDAFCTLPWVGYSR